MKKLLLLVLAAIVVVGGGVLAVRHYQHYKNLKQHSDQVAAQKASADIKKAHDQEVAKEAQLVSDYNTLLKECQKGLTAYNALAPAVKAKTVAPTCAVSFSN